MKDKVKAWLLSKKMVSPGDTIVCAVSGGPDSMAMLHLFLALREELGLTLVVCHLNHGLRGAEADRDQTFVADFCQQHDLPFFGEKLAAKEGASGKKMGDEEFGRQARYAFFARVAKQYHSPRIATAHTASDVTETVLFHLARGTGLRGLCGIPPVRDGIIRPLLPCTSTEVKHYNYRHKVPFVVDSTNAKEIYSRNRIRHGVVPVLRGINRGLDHHVFHMTEQLRQVDELLTWQAAKLEEMARVPGGFAQNELVRAPEILRHSFLKRQLEQAKITPNGEQIRQLDRLLFLPDGKWNLAGSWFAVVAKGVFSINHFLPEKQTGFCLLGQIGKNRINDTKIVEISEITAETFQNSKKVHGSPLKNVLDCDRIEKDFWLRNRIAGDKIFLAHRKVTKTLKKLFNEEKIPPDQRESRVLFVSGEKVCWVEGIGVCADCGFTSASTKGFVITVTEEQTDA